MFSFCDHRKFQDNANAMFWRLQIKIICELISIPMVSKCTTVVHIMETWRYICVYQHLHLGIPTSTFGYINIYIWVYLHIYICVYLSAFGYIYNRVYLPLYVCPCVCVCVCPCLPVCVHTHMQAYAHVLAHACTCTLTCAHAYAHAHVYAHAHNCEVPFCKLLEKES